MSYEGGLKIKLTKILFGLGYICLWLSVFLLFLEVAFLVGLFKNDFITQIFNIIMYMIGTTFFIYVLSKDKIKW